MEVVLNILVSSCLGQILKPFTTVADCLCVGRLFGYEDIVISLNLVVMVNLSLLFERESFSL